MKKTTKYLLLAFLLLTTLGLGFWMFQLAQKEQLWGHLPLFFLLSSWALVLVFFEKKYYDTPQQKRWLGWATLTGVLLWLGFPSMPFTPLLFVALVPLLGIQHQLRHQTKSTRILLRYGYHSFMLWNILSTYWVSNSALAAGVFAVVVNSFLMCIPLLAFHRTSRYINDKMAFFAFIGYWITFEKLHQWWELSWTWLTLGNAFAQYPSWVQWYEYTGVFGGTLWILVANVWAFSLAKKYFHTRKLDLFPTIQWGLWLLIPMLISVIWYYNYEEKGSPANVLVVQPNFEPHYEKFTVSEREQLRRFIDLTEKNIDAETDFVLYPETSFRSIRTNDLLRNAPLRRLRTMLRSYPDARLVTGVSAYQRFDHRLPDMPTLRETVTTRGDTIFYETYNAAIQLDTSEQVPLYKKSIFVPGAEIFPYHELFFFFKPLVDQLGGTVAGNGGQAERSVFSSPKGATAPVICYESIYGEYCTGYIKKGANAIFVVTNDGWWDCTAGHRQHLAFARLRAIETRRAVARSANTGISCFINQRGDVLQATPYGEATAIKGSILMNKGITFYTVWGDLIARIAFFVTILMLLNTFVKGRMQK